jgi:hypothetical protein
MPQNDKALLTRLNEHGVEFVIIGGVCGVLHGVPLVTFDLDVCCPFSPENVRRLEAAVKDLHPCHRLAARKPPLELSDELVARLENLYLQTDLGKLDCLSEVTGIGDYHAVLKCSVPQSTSYGEFRSLSLDALIVAKEALGRERDLAAVKLLRAIKDKLTHKAHPPKPKG